MEVNFASYVGACPIQIKSQHRVFSPLKVFVGDLAPASAANRQGFIPVENVEFNVAVAALAVPRVLACFSHLSSHNSSKSVTSAIADLKPSTNRHVTKQGDMRESEARFERFQPQPCPLRF
jgi:hypothetical protein